MKCEIYWIDTKEPLRVGTMAHPRGGDWLEDEVRSLRQQEVDVVVSLLTQEEIEELRLKDEEALCRAAGIEFLCFPIPDREVPRNTQAALTFVHIAHQRYLQGKRIVFHCRAGIGRSSLMAACLLGVHGVPIDEAFAQISRARGCPVPDTSEQELWAVRLMASQHRSLPST